MITPSFALTATERVLPRMALDFTTATLDPRVTFTRTGNTATVINSSGLVAPINADLPRFDFNPTTLACNGLLIEEARTNISLYSQDFRNTVDAGSVRPWVYSFVTLNYYPVGVLSPDGTANVCKIVEDSGTSSHYISQLITNANANFTYSVFAKDAGRRYLRMMIADVGLTSGSRVYATFDLTNGTSTIGNITATNTAATSQAFDNGWYKCSVTATITAGATVTTGLILSNTSGSSSALPSYLGDGVSGVYVYGADLQEGLFPTSYIPTVASQVTRNADVALMTGTNFSNWYNASEGAFAIWCSVPASTVSFAALSVTDGTNSERILINALSGRTGTSFRVVDNNVDQANILKAVAWTAGQQLKIVGAYKLDSFATTFNGASVLTDTSGTLPTVSQLGIGNSGLTVPVVGANFYVQELLYWPQRIIDAEVQAFSK